MLSFVIFFKFISHFLSFYFYRMGKIKNVDTSAFRCAIWNYIHCLYGIMHDDFNYSQVNQLLERNLKAYIKTVTCYPERLTKKDYDSCMQEFRHSEKVTIIRFEQKVVFFQKKCCKTFSSIKNIIFCIYSQTCIKRVRVRVIFGTEKKWPYKTDGLLKEVHFI